MSRQEVIYRHSSTVRVTHWVNVVALLVLLMSGLQIFNAHPHLYWGQQSTFGHGWFGAGAYQSGGALHGVGGTGLVAFGAFGRLVGHLLGLAFAGTFAGFLALAGHARHGLAILLLRDAGLLGGGHAGGLRELLRGLLGKQARTCGCHRGRRNARCQYGTSVGVHSPACRSMRQSVTMASLACK